MISVSKKEKSKNKKSMISDDVICKKFWKQWMKKRFWTLVQYLDSDYILKSFQIVLPDADAWKLYPLNFWRMTLHKRNHRLHCLHALTEYN